MKRAKIKFVAPMLLIFAFTNLVSCGSKGSSSSSASCSSENLSSISSSVSVSENENNSSDSVSEGKIIINMDDVHFNNKVFPYNGKANYLSINGDLPEGVIVEYINNGQTEEGNIQLLQDFPAI